jgi:hypothetical protein
MGMSSTSDQAFAIDLQRLATILADEPLIRRVHLKWQIAFVPHLNSYIGSHYDKQCGTGKFASFFATPEEIFNSSLANQDSTTCDVVMDNYVKNYYWEK